MLICCSIHLRSLATLVVAAVDLMADFGAVAALAFRLVLAVHHFVESAAVVYLVEQSPIIFDALMAAQTLAGVHHR